MMHIDRAIELLQKARQRYGGDRDMIITVELLDDILRALDRMDRDVWREPRVRRVTPEAMAELERRDKAVIMTCEHDAAWVYRWSKGVRWTANRLPATRPAWGWFIDLSTIPEGQQ